LVLSLVPSAAALAQGPPDAASLLAAQRTAMRRLSLMDGVWRGPSWIVLASGEKHIGTQTERIGPFLDGAVKVIEGRGYGKADSVTFNALGIISYDPSRKAYSLHSYAMGMAGDFMLVPSDSGYTWEIPAGPMTIRYTATIGGGKWREIGERLAPGAEPIQFFEMSLVRVGDSPWPAAGVIRPR
jgi:hypothetical protein